MSEVAKRTFYENQIKVVLNYMRQTNMAEKIVASKTHQLRGERDELDRAAYRWDRRAV